MEDKRIANFQSFVTQNLKVPVDISHYFKENKEFLEELFADRKKVDYLFFWRIVDPPEVEAPPISPSPTGLDDEEFIIGGPTVIPKDFIFEIDELSLFKSPLQLVIFYFARKKAGFVPNTSDEKLIQEFFRFGFIFQDPLAEVFRAISDETTLQVDKIQNEYLRHQLSQFSAIVKSYASTQKCIINVPRTRFIFAVPFIAESEDAKLSEEEKNELMSLFYAWNLLVQELVTDIQSKTFDEASSQENAIPEEYEWWHERAKNAEVIQLQLKRPAIQRTLHIVKTINPGEADLFFQRCGIIDTCLEEALDNMKFLKSIRRHVVEICESWNSRTSRS